MSWGYRGFRRKVLVVSRKARNSKMAKCDEGYLCEVCGEEVANLAESDLYLRYVVGLLDPEVLHTTPERHLRCNPALAQYIVDGQFESVFVEGPFDKRTLEVAYVQQQETLLTRGWQRLQELSSGETPIIDYPLPEVLGSMGENPQENCKVNK